MPDALERKYPRGGSSWPWFWVFPQSTHSVDPRSGVERRHHMFDQTFERAFKRAVQAAGITKPAKGPAPRLLTTVIPGGGLSGHFGEAALPTSAAAIVPPPLPPESICRRRSSSAENRSFSYRLDQRASSPASSKS